MRVPLCLVLLCVGILVLDTQSAGTYLIGTGIADITGPSSEVGFMGYAQLTQIGRGIHFRLRARAFAFAETASSKRVVFVNVDLCFVDVQVKKLVVDQLQQKYPGIYSYDNVLITATHTHSGPAGYSWYTIYDITCLGTKNDNTKKVVNGIVESISLATANMKPGRAYINSDDLVDPLTNVNRSPSAYENNPASERAQYKYNVEKTMVTVKLEVDGQGPKPVPVGVINFFPVHGTSMNNTNLLISGDNKGYSSLLFESYVNGNSTLPGTGPFVAAFTNGNEGDVSPNTLGAFCGDSDRRCDYDTSTCDGETEDCIARGPGVDMEQSTKIIGTQQFNLAVNLFNTAKNTLSGPVDFRHMFVDMENVVIDPQWTGLSRAIKTCTAALGDSFAAGTTDGPGDFNFRQGTNASTINPFWNFVGHFLSEPPADQIACQAPKPILLYTGGVFEPSKWTANNLPVQILRIGDLFILGVPAEFTTMAGRRLKDSVRKVLIANGAAANITVVIAGLSNAYSQYVTTTEEFHIQRYEGASTLFGPYTLNAYQQVFSVLATSLMKNTSLPPGPLPKDFQNYVPDFLPGVVFDDGPIGTINQDVKPAYSIGDLVTVVFYSADPRNDFWDVPTYLTVESKLANGTYVVIANDGNWETKFFWKRIYNVELGESSAAIQWDTQLAQPGIYRIGHFGRKKDLFGKISPFSVYSSDFKVVK